MVPGCPWDRRVTSPPSVPLSSSWLQLLQVHTLNTTSRLLKQRIKSRLEGKPRYRAFLQWLIRVLSTGKTEPHLIYNLLFWLSIIKTVVAMAIQRVVEIHTRLMSCLLGDTICCPSLALPGRNKTWLGNSWLDEICYLGMRCCVSCETTFSGSLTWPLILLKSIALLKIISNRRVLILYY